MGVSLGRNLAGIYHFHNMRKGQRNSIPRPRIFLMRYVDPDESASGSRGRWCSWHVRIGKVGESRDYQTPLSTTSDDLQRPQLPVTTTPLWIQGLLLLFLLLRVEMKGGEGSEVGGAVELEG